MKLVRILSSPDIIICQKNSDCGQRVKWMGYGQSGQKRKIKHASVALVQVSINGSLGIDDGKGADQSR